MSSPELPAESIDVGIAGIDYEEFCVERQGRALAPFELAVFSIEPATSTPLDSHAVRECWLVAAGQGLVHYDGGCYRVGSGSALLFESHRPHRVENTGPTPLTIFSVWWPVTTTREAGEVRDR